MKITPASRTPRAAARRALPLALAALLLAALVVLVTGAPSGSAHTAGPFGAVMSTAPVIDGTHSGGEWSAASSTAFSVGGRSGTFFTGNDGTNLYLSVVVNDSTNDGAADTLVMSFDNDHGGGASRQIGDDGLQLTGQPVFGDTYFAAPSVALDLTDSGTADGAGSAGHGSGQWTFELRHPLCSADSTHDFCLSAGDTVGFSLRVFDNSSIIGDWPGSISVPSGYGNIRVCPCPPANNNFASATVVGALPYTNSISTVFASLEGGEPQPCGLIGATVWYDFTPAISSVYTLGTGGSDYDTALAVYTGSSLGSLTNIDCNDDVDWPTDPTSRIYLSATAGTTYRIQAGGFNGGTGNLVFNVSGPAGTTPTPTPTPPPTPTPTPMASPTPPPTPCPDSDGDTLCDSADNCPLVANRQQVNSDADGMGNVCDPQPAVHSGGLQTLVAGLPQCSGGTDNDHDNYCYPPDPDDNNVLITPEASALYPASDLQPGLCTDGLDDNNNSLIDTADFVGCGDLDVDGILNPLDNCPTTPNTSQTDSDADGIVGSQPFRASELDLNYPVWGQPFRASQKFGGDACDPDDDNDGLPDGNDLPANPCQFDPDCDDDSLGLTRTESSGQCPTDGVARPTFRDCIEYVIGTLWTDGCADDLIANNEATDKSPPDFNDDRRVNVTDRTLMALAIKAAVVNVRFDLNASGGVPNVTDRTILALYIKRTAGAACTP